MSRCLAALASAWLTPLMPPLLKLLVPDLGGQDPMRRLGGVEITAQLVAQVRRFGCRYMGEWQCYTYGAVWLFSRKDMSVFS